MDQEDVVAVELDRRDLPGMAAREVVDADGGQLEAVAGVEHVAEAVCREANLAREDAVLGVHDELDAATAGSRVRGGRALDLRGRGRRPRPWHDAGESVEHFRAFALVALGVGAGSGIHMTSAIPRKAYPNM